MAKCGDAGGRTRAGKPCKNPTTEGERCAAHADQRILEVLPPPKEFSADDLHNKARELWERHKDKLQGERLIGFEAMCMAADQMYRAQAELMSQGTTIPDPTHGDAQKLNPAFRAFTQAQQVYLRWMDFFGDTLTAPAKKKRLARAREKHALKAV